MSKIKDTIIEEQDTGVNVYGAKTPKEHEEDNKVFCEKCLDSGIVETMGDTGTDEWGVVDEKACSCGQSPYRKIL